MLVVARLFKVTNRDASIREIRVQTACGDEISSEASKVRRSRIGNVWMDIWGGATESER